MYVLKLCEVTRKYNINEAFAGTVLAVAHSGQFDHPVRLVCTAHVHLMRVSLRGCFSQGTKVIAGRTMTRACRNGMIGIYVHGSTSTSTPPREQ